MMSPSHPTRPPIHGSRHYNDDDSPPQPSSQSSSSSLGDEEEEEARLHAAALSSFPLLPTTAEARTKPAVADRVHVNSNNNHNEIIMCPIPDLERPTEEEEEKEDEGSFHNVDNEASFHVDDDDDDYGKTCRLVARLGWYATRYGATPSRVEIFLQALMHDTFGYTGSIFRVTNTELFCVFGRTAWDDDQVMRLVSVQEGLHLHRLGLLSDLCQDVQQGRVSPHDAWDQLEAIAVTPDPWSKFVVATSFIWTGALAPTVFQGTWWDLVGGALASLPVYALTVALPPLYQPALPLLSTVAATVVALALVRWWIPPDRFHVALVVLASVIIQVPGYGASLAVSELITNHITAGLGRLVKALVTLGLLVTGYWLATNLLEDWQPVDDMAAFSSSSLFADDGNDNNHNNPPDAIPAWCQALVCAPILMLCLCFQFQISPVDVPWSFGNLMLAYGTSYGASVVAPHHKNVGVLLAATVVTLYADAWARWKDRPRSIVITPALVVLVSGSIGFRGLVHWTTTTGDDGHHVGLQEFAQMFVVALLIVAGVLVGELLLRAPTTL